MESRSTRGDRNEAAIPSDVTAQAQGVIASSDDRSAHISENSYMASGDTPLVDQSALAVPVNMSQHRNAIESEGQPNRNLGDGLDIAIEETPLPAYSETYGHINLTQNGLNTIANLESDGRVNINIREESKLLSNLLLPALRSQLNSQGETRQTQRPSAYVPPNLEGVSGQTPPSPPMNIVIHVVGSRGDVQPFVALGKVLKETYGHRVRLATHPTFRTFVTDNGLEFFSIGGDPSELMAFMVKNPGLMPGKDALRSGDIGKRRKGMYEILQGCWRSCFEAGDGTGIAVSDAQPLEKFDSTNRPFVADAIIANPPSFAHIHCAEKMGIPLHLMFTMPWSPTQSFPHPLADIQASSTDVSMTNFLSYVLVELMTWQGLGDLINRFREKSLGLESLSLMWAPGLANRLRIPYTYCWSPALIPKPKDWGSHINVSGFYFLSMANNYQPSRDLVDFLDAGPPPVYIGFGSIVLDDPNGMTKLIFDAIRRTGQRALVSKGWGGFGADMMEIPEHVFMLDNVPHDWLFQHVSCVVHHGGAGTTAAGIALGKPTVIVPFFGDQPFWGAMIARAGAGPDPVPNKHLTAEKLADAISEALKPSTLERAKELGARIASEKGSDVGAKSFHDSLNIEGMRCSIIPHRAAVWEIKGEKTRLSAFAAAVLGNEGLLDSSALELYRPKEYDAEAAPWDPIGGAASALAGTIGSLMMGGADIPVECFRLFSGHKPQNLPANATETGKSNTRNDTHSGLFPEKVGSPSRRSDSSETLPIKKSQQSSTAEVNPDGKSDKNPPSQPGESQMSHGVGEGGQFTVETAIGVSRGIGRIIDAGLKSPMDFTLALAKGFHNAPKLYGDDTVRPVDKVTGFHSGLKTAGKGFGFGLYDGISGLVTQPLEGAKKDGFTGLVKGFGKGLGGVVLKPSAAAWSVPGYTFQGVYKEIRKLFATSVQNYIIAARTAQGYEELASSRSDERLDVISRWNESRNHFNPKGKHTKWKQMAPSSPHVRGDPSIQDLEQAREIKVQRMADNLPVAASTQPGSNKQLGNTDELERAIQQSVRVTSTGNEDEDKMIERAIRASIVELQQQSERNDEEDALHRAIRASITEANRANAETSISKNSEHGFDEEHQLKEALAESSRHFEQEQARVKVTDSLIESPKNHSLDYEQKSGDKI